MTQRTDGRLRSTNYGYDNADRLTSLTYFDGITPNATYTYDQNGYLGLLTKADNTAKVTTFTYNLGGQVASELVTMAGASGTFTNSYTWDFDGRLLSMMYPSGRVVQRTYQSSGAIATDRLNTIVDNTTTTTLMQGVQDNAAGQIMSRTLGTSLVESHSFNTRNQLTGIAAALATTNVLGLTYDYGTTNNNGRIRNRTDALQPEHSVDYSYDALNRLTQVSAVNGSWGIAWQYDAYVNRWSQAPSGRAAAGNTVGTQNWGGQFINNKLSPQSYDAAGNLTSIGAYLPVYTYDTENRIKNIDNGVVDFAYDSEGRQIRRTFLGTSTYYLYGLTD